MVSDPIEQAQEVAESLLYPNAIAVDTGRRPLRANLDALAEAGYYGVVGPPEYGGAGLDFAQACATAELLAGGCLTTTLTIGQHHGTVMALTHGPAVLREKWLADLCSGAVRSGVAFTGAIPGPAKVTATAADGGYLINGTAPWVSGWGMVDVLNVAARDAEDHILWLLADAAESPHLRVTPNELVSANASNTVTVHFDQLHVPGERLISRVGQAEWARGEPPRKRLNGSFALGVAGRCAALIGDPAWTAELDACRAELDAMLDVDAARARASAFAVRAATAAVVHAGSGSVNRQHHAQRLLREAGLLLVFGSRPGIRTGLEQLLRP